MNKLSIVSLLSLLLTVPTVSWADDMYTWEDENGIHFVDDVMKVPKQYRKNKRKGINTTAPSQATLPAESDTTKQAKVDVSSASKNSVSNVESKKALNALKKLWARWQSGISHRDFAPALGDLKHEINVFNEGSEAKENSRFTDAVNAALSHFEFGSQIWDIKFEDRRLTETISRYKGAGVEVMKYPGADNRSKNGGVLVDGSGLDNTVISIDASLQIIFREAKKEIDNASAAIPPL